MFGSYAFGLQKHCFAFGALATVVFIALSDAPPRAGRQSQPAEPQEGAPLRAESQPNPTSRLSGDSLFLPGDLVPSADSADGDQDSNLPSIPGWALDALDLEPGEADRAVSNSDESLDPSRLNTTSANVLARTIEINGLSEESSPFDFDDGNGRFEPWELGFQVWLDGEIVLLATGPSRAFSFRYGIESLPESIGDLASLRVLDLHGNGLRSLPEGFERMRALRSLELAENRLTVFPRIVSEMWGLRHIGISENQLRIVPSTVGTLPNLESFSVRDNPISEIDSGALSSPGLRQVYIDQSAKARFREAPPGLNRLPRDVALGGTQELYLGGNRLFCQGRSPDPHLVDGSIPHVHGLQAQACHVRN